MSKLWIDINMLDIRILVLKRSSQNIRKVLEYKENTIR